MRTLLAPFRYLIAVFRLVGVAVASVGAYLVMGLAVVAVIAVLGIAVRYLFGI